MKLKSYLLIVFLLAFTILISPTNSYAAYTFYEGSHVVTYVNGEKEPLNQSPIMFKGRPLLPLRPLVETLGYAITFDTNSNAVYIYEPSSSPEFFTDPAKDLRVVLNNIVLDFAGQPIINHNNHLYAPYQLIVESLGYESDWNQTFQTITIAKDVNHDINHVNLHLALAITGSFETLSNVKIVSRPKPTDISEVELVGITVYITKTGDKYHEHNCQYLRQSRISIDLARANFRRYTPCSVCTPPIID